MTPFGHLRCESARGTRHRGPSLWVALNGNRRILNSIQTCTGSQWCRAGTPSRTQRKITSRSQLYLSGSKASRHISEMIRLQKNFKLNIVTDGVKNPHKTKKITKLNYHSKEKTKDCQTKKQKDCRVEDKSTPSHWRHSLKIKHKQWWIKLSEVWKKDMNKGQGAQQEHTLVQNRRGRLYLHTGGRWGTGGNDPESAQSGRWRMREGQVT